MTFDIDDFKALIEISVDREIDDLDPEANLFNDIGMDSMGVVVLIVEIQRKTRVRIPDSKIHELLTPSAYLEYINEALKEVKQV